MEQGEMKVEFQDRCNALALRQSTGTKICQEQRGMLTDASAV
jgi:hypothetical protein